MKRVAHVVVSAAALLVVVPCADAGTSPAKGGWLYWTDSTLHVIRRSHLDGSNIETLFDSAQDGVSNPIGLALHPDAGKVYWTQGVGANRKVRYGSLDGSGSPTDLVTQSSSIGHIALDIAGGKMYWLQPTAPGGVIYRANLDDGTEVEQFQVLFSPKSLAIDPSTRMLYWGLSTPTFSCTADSRIQRISLDGRPIIEDVLVGLKVVNAVAVDSGAAKIYWGELCDNEIRRANVDASRDEQLLMPAITPGIAIDAGAGKFYWAQTSPTVAIKRANLNGTSIETLLDVEVESPISVAVLPALAGILGDLNDDGIVNGIDLALLLGSWGACPRKGPCDADLNGDNFVTGIDLAILLGAWTS